MNTANLQLEGLLLALSSLLAAMKAKGLLTQLEIDSALEEAERFAERDTRRPPELSDANVDAIRFPIRFLRLASAYRPDTFNEITTAVGQMKKDY
jgi:hypothetical protein